MSFHDLPQSVGNCVIGAAVSAVTALGTMIADMVDPKVAEEYGLKGLLIVAVVCLVGFCLYLLKWIARELITGRDAATNALNRVADAVEGQVAYFEDIAKRAINDRLDPHEEPPTKRIPRTRL